MRRGHWLVPLFLGSFVALWSSYVSAMMFQEFGATMKRQCGAFNAAHSSMDYSLSWIFFNIMVKFVSAMMRFGLVQIFGATRKR